MGGHPVTRHDFDLITLTGQWYGKCPVCGVRTRKQIRFEQTINPWNLNPDGTMKTRADIYRELGAEVKAYKPDFRHEKCKTVHPNQS